MNGQRNIKQYQIEILMGFTVFRATKIVPCAHQGLSDLTAHCSGKIHKSCERAIKTTRSMSSLKGFEAGADTNLAGQNN